MYLPASKWGWAFLIVTLIQTIVILAIESYIFAQFQSSLLPGLPEIPQIKPIPTDLSLFIFAFLYQLILVYDSLRLKNTIQVFGICFYNIGILIYASIQVDQIHKAILQLQTWTPDAYIDANSTIWSTIQPLLIAVPCLIAFFTILLALVSWKLYDEFSWTIYKHISADLRMRRRFLTFQIYITFLKFDFFFFVGFTVQFLVVVTNITDIEFGLTTAAIPITILILLMAAYFTRNEKMHGMYIVTVLYFGGLAYFIFKLARMYQPSHETDYLPARKSMTAFAVITIILILLTIANTIVCMYNFDKGLKPLVTRRKIKGEDEKSNMTELPDLKHGAPAPVRMTID